MSKKFTSGKALFWLITGILVLVCSIVLGIIPGIFIKLMSLLGGVGGAVLYLLGGIILIISLIILGVSAQWGTKQASRWKRG